jgi:hypothetical protein
MLECRTSDQVLREVHQPVLLGAAWLSYATAACVLTAAGCTKNLAVVGHGRSLRYCEPAGGFFGWITGMSVSTACSPHSTDTHTC